MSKKITTEEFIERAKEIHGDRYDYSKVIYVKSIENVIITCPIHGDFEQSPNSHLCRHGCRKCNQVDNSWTYSKFVEVLTKKLGGTVPYKIIGEYNGSQSKILIEDVYGVCSVKPNNLLRGVTSGIISAVNKDLYFINMAVEVHGLTYDYSLVKYTNFKTKIKIICRKHGIFEQDPSNHLEGNGCPSCKNEKISIFHKNNPTGWSKTSWKAAAEKSKNFDSFKVNIIKCWDENEEFYKIGRTFLTTKQRFKNITTMPYNYEIIQEIVFEDAHEACEKENELKNLNKENKYLPLNKFNGRYECFKIIKE
jgi:hypothetical protein